MAREWNLENTLSPDPWMDFEESTNCGVYEEDRGQFSVAPCDTARCATAGGDRSSDTPGWMGPYRWEYEPGADESVDSEPDIHFHGTGRVPSSPPYQCPGRRTRPRCV